MTPKDFKAHLTQRGYSFTEDNGAITVTHQGYVYLESLTTLPEGVAFNNHGYVYLESLTTLPEGVAFNNHGGVYLESLTTLPAGVAFNNQGTVYLRSLTGKHAYKGKSREFRCIDGYTMIVESSKSKGNATIHSVRYFGGGEIEKLSQCYIAEADGHTAHGGTVKQAIDDLNYKIADDADKTEVASTVVQSGQVTLAQFRALTGACTEGTRHHLAQQGIQLETLESMPLAGALKAMAGTAFGDTFKTHIEAAQ